MLMPPPLISSTRQLAVARLLGQLLQLDGDLRDVLLVGVADHRHEQPAIGVHRHADVHVLLVDDLAALGVDRGVELRELLHRGRQHLHQHRGDGEVAAGLGHLVLELLAQLLERGDVRLVELRDVRNGVPGVAEMLGRDAADVGPRLALDLAPLREVGQRPGGAGGRRRQRRGTGRADAAQDAARVLLDVLLRDAPAGPVPSTALMSTPISRASRRTAGEAGARACALGGGVPTAAGAGGGSRRRAAAASAPPSGRLAARPAGSAGAAVGRRAGCRRGFGGRGRRLAAVGLGRRRCRRRRCRRRRRRPP